MRATHRARCGVVRHVPDLADTSNRPPGRHRSRARQSLSCLTSSFLFPAMPITALEDLLRAPNLLIRRAGYAKGGSELVDHALIGRGDRASHGLLPHMVRTLPVRVRVAAGQPWARLVVVLAKMRFRRAFAVVTHQRGFPGRRALELLFRH